MFDRFSKNRSQKNDTSPAIEDVTEGPSLIDSFVGAPDDIAARWASNEDSDALTFPAGLVVDDDNVATGETVYLDPVEGAVGGVGPHGLLDGDAGTGKSSLLRNWVTALAATHSPTRVHFVLADFKGGSTFDGFENLPHTRVMFSNLDASENPVEWVREQVESLISIRSRLLQEAGVVGGYRDYNEKARSRADMTPISDIFLVVDEIGAALHTHPGLNKVIGKVAALGRSLGIHLLLAGQHPDLGDARAQFSYAVSLRGTSGRPTAVASDKVATLPGRSVALLEHGGEITQLRGFDPARSKGLLDQIKAAGSLVRPDYRDGLSSSTPAV